MNPGVLLWPRTGHRESKAARRDLIRVAFPGTVCGRVRRDIEKHGVLVASAISDPVAGRLIALNYMQGEYIESLS